ncbi:ester cyclase [Amycolatopsis taiwanensis]|uniref:SnoaL-like domain-containing protein n=1 Tax=Amycolatopsis taiwanensis TaxID=342230 RepID=A0A9W6QVB7_9PSEU|nr:nuclear transport factor 2 family protein [Amycolatopsis taiwanensis]GLY64244.1 hypothetical protein Atai01_08630 [Amycolatopsis taiwanensis]
MRSAATTHDTAQVLWEKWTALWNGDLSQAEQVLATDFTLHVAVVGADEGTVQGTQGLVDWISLLRTLLGGPTFTVQVGPLIDGDLLCGRWQIQGHYAGGMPGATAAPGTPIAFTGTDILRVDNGLLAEYWLNSDVHVMSAQLGIIA